MVVVLILIMIFCNGRVVAKNVCVTFTPYSCHEKAYEQRTTPLHLQVLRPASTFHTIRPTTRPCTPRSIANDMSYRSKQSNLKSRSDVSTRSDRAAQEKLLSGATMTGQQGKERSSSIGDSSNTLRRSNVKFVSSDDDLKSAMPQSRSMQSAPLIQDESPPEGIPH